ncbi:Putative tubulin-tyrosine ligase family protein [Trichuris trichiura]|uniref:Putative tubulin-tyrosine ligase family protein n=1 Tax=Trichuris trichiura TaxID=36087 RepID=A0A077Z8I9_TRITR|nr:Putative tubulin-tyrosine ligase family protein [Trichuris trichiura]
MVILRFSVKLLCHDSSWCKEPACQKATIVLLLLIVGLVLQSSAPASQDSSNIVELENLTLDEFDDLLNAASQPSYRSTNGATGARSEKVDRALKSLREQADSERRQADDESETSFTNYCGVSSRKSILKLPANISESTIEIIVDHTMVANREIEKETEESNAVDRDGLVKAVSKISNDKDEQQQDVASIQYGDSNANGVIEIVRSTRHDGFCRNSNATVSELVNLVGISRIDKSRYVEDELPTFSIETLHADRKLHSVREALSVDLTELDGPCQLSLRSVQHSLPEQQQIANRGDMALAIPVGSVSSMDARLLSRLAKKRLERQKRLVATITAEQIKGHRGHLPVESLLEFIDSKTGKIRDDDPEDALDSSEKDGNLKKMQQKLKASKDKKKQSSKKQTETDDQSAASSPDVVVENSFSGRKGTYNVSSVGPLEEERLKIEAGGGSSGDIGSSSCPEDNGEFIPVKSRRGAKTNKENGRRVNRPVRSTTPPPLGKNRCTLYRRRSSVEDGRNCAKHFKPLCNPVRSYRCFEEFDTRERCRNAHENGESSSSVASCSSQKGAAASLPSSDVPKYRVSINSHASFPSLSDMNGIDKEDAATSSDRPGKVYDSLCLEETSRVRPLTTYASVTSGFPPVSFNLQRRRRSVICNGQSTMTTPSVVSECPKGESDRDVPGSSSGGLARSQSIPMNGVASRTMARQENAHFPVDRLSSTCRGAAHSVNNGIDRSSLSVSGKRPVQFFDRSLKNATGVGVHLSFGFDVDQWISGNGDRSKNADYKPLEPTAAVDVIENAHLVSQDGNASSAVVNSSSVAQGDATLATCERLYTPTEADKKLRAFLKQGRLPLSLS